MAFVLICVAAGEEQANGIKGDLLRPSHLAQIEAFMDRESIAFMPSPMWLKEHKAAQFAIPGKPTADQWHRLKDLLAPDKIDVFITSAYNRRKKLLLADMDATIIAEETLDELAARAGLKEAVSTITARAMRGELDFIQALNERVAMLKDLPLTALKETLDHATVNPGAVELVQTMRHHGATCVLVSGGFTYFTKAVAGLVGFNHSHGNTLDMTETALTGKVIPPILDKNAKLEYLKDYRTRMNIKDDETMAVGDGANDLPMLQAAGVGVGYYGKPAVAEALENNVQFTDLTSLLYIQGYRWQEIEHALHCDGHSAH